MLVREGSEDKLERAARPRPATGRTASSPSRATSPSRASASSDEDKQALQGVEHFFHLAAIYDMTDDDEERNRRLNVLGTQNAVDLANELGAGQLPLRVLDRRRRRARRALHRGRLRRRPEARPTRTTAPSSRPRSSSASRSRAPWRVYRPAIVVGDSQDRRDGQDRRALLLLQGDPEGPQHAAAVVPARRARGRQDEHRAGRLRRRRDGPHRAPGRARRPRLPPRQPEDAEGRAT